MRKIVLLIIILFILLVVSISALILMPFNFGGKIAKVYLCNEIYYDYSPSGFFEKKRDANYYINLLDKLEKDKSVKGVLLIINSPGGEVVASEELAKKVKEVSEKKPVVAYIQTIGASGAYMVASSSNYIVAQRHSVVGSIGVRMDIIHFYGLMKKLGINVTTIKAGKYKDIGSPYRPMTPEEKKILEKMINETYNYFIMWVAKNRNLSINYTKKIAEGKIYLGEDAKKVGLVDEVGDEEVALKKLEELANVTNPTIEEYGLSETSGFFGLDLERLAYYFGYGVGKGLSSVFKELNVKIEG
ncbi:signal peptide peptidase SppA, 36K type [Methanocaldococcus infernus ME]|uniref:Signal peptide peptidase SppA, 36K type n=1 Tax=Methanocaldococcus infernus (strain DSM 11812 / JCM 15783 / ME) TaxID=573063 RepID=D5VSM9_METIM|nr:signal peptide peptidase SppA [Methanocaldococcus infernus]ADG13582.1 signal peptide peptidase SppA, 36K type [Methanocaldococcus infernus ME]